MSDSQILRIPSGYLNQVNDAAIGQSPAPSFNLSEFGGQLGKWADFDPDNVRYNSAIGTLYGGRYQYVRLAAAAAVPVVGQILFWDTTVAQGLFQVTTDPTLSSTDAGVAVAGICLYSSITAGNYTVIQIPGNGGQVVVQLRAVLTTAGAVGSRLFATGQTGADEGFADVLTAESTSLASAQHIGWAIGLPVGGSTVLMRLVQRF